MIPFKTTPEQIMNLASIVVEMKAAGVDPKFIVNVFELARTDQGVYDLMAMWLAAKNEPAERTEVVADLQEALDDYQDAPTTPLEKPYIKFDKLGDVARQVVEHKKRLRNLIDRNGGVSSVAHKCGIPQPSLSRMLNSASMPRRSTLYKIANALNVEESEIVTEWSR
ncbi:MAG: helix-turn-helix transcriptional regulator [Myxococcales bacterium]|nr:helix-turn-helix transcriptional regulator [Myxococcales bacterium]